MEVSKLSGTAWLAYENGNAVLIDTGTQADGTAILRRINALGLKVPLIFLTHTHYDHTGGVEAIRQATAARVMAGEAECAYLRGGHTPVPKGTSPFSSVLSRVAHSLQSAESREHYVPVSQDIIEAGESGELGETGWDAQYMHLGAHTAGSVGLRIGDYFFAGDTVFAIGNVIYPPFADMPEEIPGAWRKIIGSGAKYICPGHGRMIGVERLKKEYAKRFGLL